MSPSSNDQPDRRPVFLHTLFRSGGTYVWAQFRKDASYTAYYEPFNEVLADYRRDSYAKQYESIRELMRHADVKQEYFAEYPVDAEGRIPGFKPEFAYDLYALAPDAPATELQSYLEQLFASATARPVCKFCRSALRLDWLDQRFAPLNVAVFRNPRDQWQSFNSFAPGYFHAIHLLTTAHLSRHPLLDPLSSEISIPRYPSTSRADTIEFYQLLARHLDKPLLYFTFYYWWCVSLLEMLPRMDLFVDIDIAQNNNDLAHQAQELDLPLDFSDCRPQTYSSHDLDSATFDTLEHSVEALIAQALPESIRTAAGALKKHAHLGSGSIPVHIKRLEQQITGSPSRTATQDSESMCDQWLQTLNKAYPHCIAEVLEQAREQARQQEIERRETQEYVESLNAAVTRLQQEIDQYPKTLIEFVGSRFARGSSNNAEG